MGSTRTDKINLDVIINGDRAGKTLDELTKAQRELNSQLKKVAIGSEEYIKLKGELQNVNTKLSDTRKEIKGVGDQMSKGKELAREMAGAFGLAFGIHSVIEFGKASIEAFREAEKNANALEFALKNIAGEGKGALDKLIEQSEKMQETSIFSDDDVQVAQKMLVQLGLNSAQVEQLLPKIADLATAQGISLPEATDIAIKAINGQTRGLKEAGLEFKDTGDKTENLSILTEKLTKFQGAAADALNTSAGQAKKLANEIDNLQEDIGSRLVPMLDSLKHAALESLQGVLDLFTTSGREFQTLTSSAVGFSREQAKLLVELGFKADGSAADIRKNGKEFIDLNSALAESFKAAEQNAGTNTDKIAALARTIVLADKDLLKISVSTDEGAIKFKLYSDAIEKARQRIEDLKQGSSLGKTLKDTEKEIEKSVKKIEKIVFTELGPKGLQIIKPEAVKEQFAFIPKEVENITTQIQESLKRTQPRIDEILSANAENFLTRNQEKVEATIAIFGQLNELTKDNAEANKIIASSQALIQTFLGATAAIARADIFPLNIALAATITAAGLANVAKINGVGFAEGGPTNRPTFAKGGRVNKPFMALAGEAGPEWIAPNWMTENPKLAPVFDILENIRTSKTYAAGGPTTSTQTPAPAFTPSTNTGGSVNGELLIAVRQLTAVLQSGIQAKFDYDYFQKSTARVDAAKSSAQIGKS